MIVVDASVLAVALVADGGDGSRARNVLREAGTVVAPDLASVETIAVLRKRWLGGTIDLARFEHAVRDLNDLPIRRVPSSLFMRRAFELRDNVTVYDAVYVALAETLDCPLVTGDAKLASSPGPTCTFQVLQD